MKTPQEQYQHYRTLHQKFSENYVDIYKHVMQFSPLPKQFISSTSPELERFVCNFSPHENNADKSKFFESLFYFANDFKTFATYINQVFQYYKSLHDDSATYMKNVFRLKEKNNDLIEPVSKYIELIPELTRLLNGFQTVKDQTDDAAIKLENLQDTWHRICSQMNSVFH